MKLKKGLLFLFTAILAAALIFSGCKGKKDTQANQGQDIDKIRLGVMTNGTTDYVAEVGLAEGIFAKHGLEVEVTAFAMGINTIDAVTIGQMDIGGGADFAVLNRLGGSPTTPLRIFAGLGDIVNNSKLYTRDPDIQSPADLRGKSIVVSLGTVNEYYHAKTLAAVGIPESEVKFLPVDGNMEGVALIQNGTAHAMWANGLPEESLLKIPGIHAIATLSDYVASTVHVGIATEQYLKENQRAVEKYLKATEDIYDFMAKEPQKTAEILQKAHAVPLEQTALILPTWLNFVNFDQKFYDAMESLYEWAEDGGIIKNPYDLHSYVNVDALRAAYPGRGDFK
jgi:NitT/TauT family transport system substrate-binding protein